MGSTWGKRVRQSRNLAAIARRQRINMSEAEMRLWDLLKNRQLGGYRFERQHLLGNQVVDFFCHSERLIIEIARPESPSVTAGIAAMDEALRQRGFSVLRLTEGEVMRRPDAAVLQVFQA